MKAAYENAKAGEPGLGGYDRWFAQQPNNAALAAIGIYTDRVPAFRELLHEANGDLPSFYERVRAMSLLPKRTRDAQLDTLSARAAAASMSARHGETRRSRLIRNGFCCYNRGLPCLTLRSRRGGRWRTPDSRRPRLK